MLLDHLLKLIIMLLHLRGESRLVRLVSEELLVLLLHLLVELLVEFIKLLAELLVRCAHGRLNDVKITEACRLWV